MRLFVGTLLGESTQRAYQRFIDALIAHHGEALRSIPQRSAHLTYAFCAEAEDGALETIRAAVQRIAATYSPFTITAARPHVVPPGGRPRLVCAPILNGEANVRQLTTDFFASLSTACPGLAWSPSRSPHVTLARFRKQATGADRRAVSCTLAEAAGGIATDHITHVQVVGSTLTASGPVYEVRAEVPLFGIAG